MLPMTQLTDGPIGFREPEVAPQDGPFDLTPEDLPAPPPAKEFVMGPLQIASVAFVGILLIGMMSAIAYFAGRKNTSPQVTERVIERVVAAAPVAPKAEPKAAVPEVVPVLAAKPFEKAEVTTPSVNRTYLQLGSVDVGVAEVMVEGLLHRGVPAIVGFGISNNVARVLVGPFTSPDEQKVAQKHIEEMGFRPFPRVFTEKDLEQQRISTTRPAKP